MAISISSKSLLNKKKDLWKMKDEKEGAKRKRYIWTKKIKILQMFIGQRNLHKKFRILSLKAD